ncbi:uncharacterized protein K02A2.6-like [Asterias rubens]|uniref:uncharacterized protein K02A2.6-like n=2 Tax=Asterias rubens TaxID=7604 RepID=UPI0014550BE3|nr:uncharacterized protein K02A2.6-like [Asterias rubens]
MAQNIKLNGVEKFDPHGDPAQLRQMWRRWLRGFEYFAVGKGVTNQGQKKALLLHCTGPDVQDIFFSLTEEEGTDEYDKAVKTLNKHFEVKINVPYERYGFRNMEQAAGETVDQYIVRLRQKALLCEFDKSDEEIRDQVIAQCKSHKIRTKLLEKGQSLTLDRLRMIATNVELTEKQSKDMEAKKPDYGPHVNAVRRHKASDYEQRRKNGEHGDASKGYRGGAGTRQHANGDQCFRCGHRGHYARDQECPARNAVCNKCGNRGHYGVACKTQTSKNRKDNYEQKDAKWRNNKGQKWNGTGGNKPRGKVHTVQEDTETGSDTEFAFHVGMVGSNKEEKIKVSLGQGIPVDVIIDSGASVNIIDKSLWEELKGKRIQCKSERSNKKLYAYGSTNPLKVLGKFVTKIKVDGMSHEDTEVEADFYVTESKGPALLGKDTSVELGVLKIGVNLVAGEVIDSYPECFQGVGKLKDHKLKLHIDKEVRPVAQHMYRVPYTLREKVSDKLDELESLSIIEKVNHPTSWVSPVIVVPKPNGDIRLCVDMRQANKAIIRERHPIPTVDEILYNMNGSEVFSKLDMKYGYHQIELEEDSREITTFVTHKGLYRYTRLMFGISAAPEKYQQVIAQVLHDCEGVQNISDDIVVHGKNQAEHDERLVKVMQRLKEKNLTLNKEKCQFGLTKITFMGHVLSKNGVEPTEGRIKAMKEARPPNNAAEIKSFLGLVNFSARYIPNLATVAEPLRRLTRKNEKFTWGKEQQNSFDVLKDCLTKTETLGYYRLDATRTQLVTDASNVGLGAVLLQEYEGETRVISYASRTLSDVETRYSTTEKEALAVVWACEKFQIYLYGLNFELITDHKPLEVLYGPKSKPNARIERWVLRLMPFTYTIRYAPGPQNIADVLSRLVKSNVADKPNTLANKAEEYVKFVAEQATPKALTTREVEEASKDDAELIKVRKCLAKGDFDKSSVNYFPIRNELSSIGYLVLRGTRLVIPKTLRTKCVELAHRGHLGIVGTKQRLRSKVWWPNMDKDVLRLVRSCHGCQLVSAMPNPEPLHPTQMPTGPWQDLAIDLLGPLPSKHYVFVVVDYYSRFYEVEIMKDTTTAKIVNALENMFSRYGLPRSITSDNGPQFRSEVFKEYLNENGINHRLVTPLHPAANGEVERQNRSLMKRIRIAHAQSQDWKREIRSYMFAYRTTPHSTTGVSPAELMFGRKLRTKLPQIEELEYRNDEEVQDRDALMKHKNKLYVDNKRRAEESDLKKGDAVLVKQSQQNKMSTPFHAVPYTLVEKQGNSCTVESPEGVKYKRNSTHVKKYQQTESDTSQESIEDPIQNEDISGDIVDPQVSISSPMLGSPRAVRTTRNCLPKRFDDFVMDV